MFRASIQNLGSPHVRSVILRANTTGNNSTLYTRLPARFHLDPGHHMNFPLVSLEQHLRQGNIGDYTITTMTRIGFTVLPKPILTVLASICSLLEFLDLKLFGKTIFVAKKQFDYCLGQSPQEVSIT